MNYGWLSLNKGDIIMIAPGKERYKDEISSWFGYVSATEIIDQQTASAERIQVLSQLNRDELEGCAILVLDNPFKMIADSIRVRMNVLIDGRIVQLIAMKGNVKDWIKL